MSDKKLSIRIPFDGFYGTIHEQLIDEAYESLFQDESGNTYEDIYDKAYVFIGSDSFVPYSKMYLNELEGVTGLSFEFDTLTSPKEYNMATDQIYAFVSKDDVVKMHSEVDDGILRSIIKDDCTSREGFFSHYSPSLNEWAENPLEWDHNELEILLKAWAKSMDIELNCDDYSKLSENANNAIYENMSNDLKNVVEEADERREMEASSASIS